MPVLLLFGLLAASSVLWAAPGEASGGLLVSRLRTEYRTDPLGVDAARPRLSWELALAPGARRGEGQSAYRILAASAPERLREGAADVWDSGRVASAASVHVEYDGRPLRSGERVYWTVRAWDRQGNPSPYAAPARWEMGLLEPGDWSAAWIGHARPPGGAAPYAPDPAPLLRSRFTLPDAPVRRARAYVTGLGYYELRLNGERVGDRLLDPAWTDYEKRVFYSVYDVTDRLRPGENVVGALLGNGWYRPLPLPMFGGSVDLTRSLPTGEPKLLLRLEIDFADGTRRLVATGDGWRASDGPIIENDVYLGEVYDARREPPGWDAPGFDDRGWRPARRTTPPGGRLVAQPLPPIRAQETIRPVAITEPEPGVFIFDFGQNFAGWATLRVGGPAGTRVQLRYGELLFPDGRLNVLTSTAGQVKDWAAVSREDWAAVDAQPYRPDGAMPPQTAWQSDVYFLRGGGEERYTPRFTFHGFRYVEVRGYPGRPPLDALEGRLLRTDVEPAGRFESSSELLGRIQEMVLWTQKSNMFGVQSDCPHRERFGYGGDIVAASEMAMLNFDMAGFYEKVVHDFADAVRPNGGFTEIAPDVGIADEGLGDGSGPVGWGTAHPMLVWQLYQYYGDRRLLEEQYEHVGRWIELLASRAEGHILVNGISDHESLVPKPVAVSGTGFYFYNVELARRMAAALGRADDAARYAARADSVRDAFNRRFLEPGTGRYDRATQAAQAFALYFDLAPPVEREAAFRRLLDDLDAHGGHLTTGIFGTKYLLDVLSRHGRADVAYALASKTDFPSWGFMLENGATTLWEDWKFSLHVKSHNHPMFGSVSEWFYKWLAGLQPDPAAVGFDRIVVRPSVVGDLTRVEASHRTVRGVVESRWRRDGDRLELDVTVPVSATAVVHVPSDGRAAVLEGDGPAADAEGVRLLREEAGAVVYEVGAGRYRFRSAIGNR